MSNAVLPYERKVSELPFLLRVLWFVIVGWEVAGIWILIAWALNLTIVGLPIGLWMIDRLPQVLTLKSSGGYYVMDKSGAARFLPQRQAPFLLRTLYFLIFGWWVSLLWAGLGWLLCATIIGLPFGLLMLHTLPFVTTLRVN